MKKKKDSNVKITYIGGQAVIEGVMMRGRRMYAMAVRQPDGQLNVEKTFVAPASDKYPILKWPIVRGVAAFVDSLVMGMKLISRSAEMAGLEEEVEGEPSKFEAFLTRVFGDKLNKAIMSFSVVIAVVLAVGLFMLLPVWIAGLFSGLRGHAWALGIVEGLIRIVIFVAYVALVSLAKDIRRVYEYHGAEHKTINCYEHGQELTVENVSKFTRLHKRCGTSFLFIVMILAMLLLMLVQFKFIWLKLLSRIILIPVIAGLSYELIRWAGRSDNWLVNAVSFPGLMLQKITTKEPDASEMEAAIAAMKAVLENEPG